MSAVGETVAAGRVTAVVVTYNRPDDLRACLAALNGQSRAPDDVIVVDNASDPPVTVEGTDPRVRVVREPVNGGGAGGFHRGMSEALSEADWLWLMDDDCVPHPAALDELLRAAAQADPEHLAAVAPTVLYDGVPAGAGWQRGGRPGGPEADGAPFIGLLVRAEAVLAVGLPRADFFIWLDDTEFCLRLRLRGWRIVSAPGAQIAHPALPMLRGSIGRRPIEIPAVPPWKEYYRARNGAVLSRLLKDTVFEVPPAPLAALRAWVRIARLDPAPLARLGMRLAGRLDAARGRMGATVAPGETDWRSLIRRSLRAT